MRRRFLEFYPMPFPFVPSKFKFKCAITHESCVFGCFNLVPFAILVVNSKLFRITVSVSVAVSVLVLFTNVLNQLRVKQRNANGTRFKHPKTRG